MVSRPPFDLRPQPQLQPTSTTVDERPWHLEIPRLVLAHRVAMRQAENRGDFLSIDEVVHVDPASHAETVHRLAAEPYERTLPSDASITFHT